MFFDFRNEEIQAIRIDLARRLKNSWWRTGNDNVFLLHEKSILT